MCVRGTRLHICLDVRGVMNKARNRIKEKGLVEGLWYCPGEKGTRVSREGMIDDREGTLEDAERTWVTYESTPLRKLRIAPCQFYRHGQFQGQVGHLDSDR